MEFFLMIFLTSLLGFSRAKEELGDWTMDQPIYNLTGETFYLRYTAKADLKDCVFITPGPGHAKINVDLGSKIVNISEDRPSNWTFKWYGMNNKSDCGIEVISAIMEDRGTWTVIATPVGNDFDLDVKTTNVTINKRAAPEKILLNPNTFRTRTMEPGRRPILVTIVCKAYKTRGNVTFTWWIGDNQLSGNVSDYRITNYISQKKSDQYKDVSQTIRYYPVPSHDGKLLRCNASHSEYTKEDLANKTNIAAVDITIKAPPVPYEEDIVFKNHPLGNQNITIKFHSNPPPKSIYWEMHDTHHPILETESTGRYTALRLKPVEYHDYNATIRVSNLSESDAGIQNKLWVENGIDKTSYTFTFNFEDPDQVKVAGLSVGAIVGIVLGCLGAVCLIWLVVSQLRKKRKSKKITQEEIAETRDEMRETSRTQHQDD